MQKISLFIKDLFESIKAIFALIFGPHAPKEASKDFNASPDIDKKGDVGKTGAKVEDAVNKMENSPKPVPAPSIPVPRMPPKKIPQQRPDSLVVSAQTVKHWAKQSRHTATDEARNEIGREIEDALKLMTDGQLAALFKHDAENMAQVLENHPKSFANPDKPQTLALIAGSLFTSDHDREAKGMGNVLTEVVRKIESNPTEGHSGCLSQQSLDQYYNILKAFADGPPFHCGIARQLIAIVRKINHHDFSQKETPVALEKKIHKLAATSQREFASRRKAEKEKPPVTPERKNQIQDMARSTLSTTPKEKLYKLRGDLTKMAKAGEEIRILVETLTSEQLKNLWIFELNIDNRAEDPIPRLSQMFSNISADQFVESLTCPEFRLLIRRYPPAAAIGFTKEQLAALAKSDDLDEALAVVYELVHGDKKVVLEDVHRRRKEFLEAQRKLQVKRVVTPLEVYTQLSAQADPIAAGRLMDDLPKEVFPTFIAGLGVGELLTNLWRVERKVMNAETNMEVRRKRLGNIFKTLSADQVQASVGISAFREIIANSTDKYAHKVAETMQDDHFAIIARHPDALHELSVVVKCCNNKRPNLFLILLSTVESMPAVTSLKNRQQGDGFHKLKTVIESFYAALLKPHGGWGVHGDRNGAVKHLQKTLEEKSKILA